MKMIATAALLATIGSAAALAQGAPPGSSSWKTSAWDGDRANSVATAQVQGMSGARASAMAKNGTIPVASGLSRNNHQT